LVFTPLNQILEQIIGLEQTNNEIKRKLEQMRAIDNGYKIKVFKIDYNPPSVDTIDDLMKIRLIFRKNNFKSLL
jgi:3-deoxy-manno-octulosonate cytidylyltransferase (CMP-KDO synthetase)